MSCFQGQMNEYKGVALDRFDGRNLDCTTFFLSHCHKDHMAGLNTSAFYEHLKSSDGSYLYCTEISRLLLLADQDYCHLKKFIRVLDAGEPRHICVRGRGKNKEKFVYVTPISAGHCLGSVMFLFEGDEGAVLYTGDFRWEVEQAARITAFQSQGSLKNLKTMYVDTTFCIPDAFHIPSRNECVEAAFALISDWLGRSRCDVVSISTPARYGHEHFLLELAKRLNTKIHVPTWKVAVYDQIPELKDYFSDNASLTVLHCCSSKSGFIQTSVLPCGYRGPSGGRLKLLNIRPSTMWFTSSKTKANSKDLVVTPATQRGLHRVCYSMHSSYSEIRDFVSFIKPEKVFPNVLPASDKDMTTVKKRLESFINHPNKFRLMMPTDADVFRPLGTLKKMERKTSKLQKVESFESGSDELVFSSQELSPYKSAASCHDDKNTVSHQTDLTPTTSSEKDCKFPTDHVADCSGPPINAHKVSLESPHSSYSGSDEGHDDKEIDLFSDEDYRPDGCNTGHEKNNSEESVRLYISGESETEDSDHEEDDLVENCAGDGGIKNNLDAVVKQIDNKKGPDSEACNVSRCNFDGNSSTLGNEMLSYNNKSQEFDDNLGNGESDDDIIPNSQETAVEKYNSPYTKKSGGENMYKVLNKSLQNQINDNNSSNLCDKEIIPDDTDVRSFHSQSHFGGSDTKHLEESASSQGNGKSSNCASSEKSHAFEDCVIVLDSEDSEKSNTLQSVDFASIKKSTSVNSEKDQKFKHHTLVQRTSDKSSQPHPVKKSNTDDINCSIVLDDDVHDGNSGSDNDGDDDVNEIKAPDEDGEDVKYLYEDKANSQAAPCQSGWLSKNRRKQGPIASIPSVPQLLETKMSPKMFRKASKVSNKRKIETEGSNVWYSKFNSHKDKCFKLEDGDNRDVCENEMQKGSDLNIVDLTMDESL